MKKLYKEPLLHFLIIGTLIFVVFSIVNKEKDVARGNKIIVSTAEIERFTGSLLVYSEDGFFLVIDETKK